LTNAIATGEIRGLLICGEDVPESNLGALDFLVVQDLHLTATAQQAEVVLPASSYAESKGSFTAADGQTRQLKSAVACPLAWDNAQQIMALATQAGYTLPYRTVAEIQQTLAQAAPPPSGVIRLAAAEEGAMLRAGYVNTNELSASLLKYAAENGCK
jgi:formate dehydrogenase major subunit